MFPSVKNKREKSGNVSEQDPKTALASSDNLVSKERATSTSFIKALYLAKYAKNKKRFC